MKNWEKLISSVNFIGLFVGLIYMLFFHSHEGAVNTNTIEKNTIKIYDSTKKVIVPKMPASLQTFCLVPVPMDVDTAAILRNFFAIYTYSQSIVDTNIHAELFDTISQNKILGRKLTYRLIKPVKTIESTTITIQPNYRGFYLGGFIDGNKTSFGIGPKISFNTKNNVQFGYDFDVLRNIHRVNLQKKINW